MNIKKLRRYLVVLFTLLNIAILCNLSPVFAADTTAPKNGRISINSGNEYSNSNFVTLDIYAEDDSSIQVWISNDGENGTVVDFEVNKTVDITDSSYVVGTVLDDTNSTTTTNEDNVLRITNWPVTEGDGSKRVHVVFRDEFGNITSLTGYITITVTYDLNGVDGSLPSSEETLKGMGVYLPTLDAADDSIFLGWSASPTADIASYYGNSLVAFSGDTTLYAVFQMPQIGDYIDYGIKYTDAYTGYKYSGDEGWRILSATKNSDGTLNIEIISTGIPAKLYYHHEYIDSASWVGNASQRAKYSANYYISESVDNNNIKASAGLMYNFEKINFSQGTGEPAENKGLYTEIKGSQNTSTGLFKASNLPNNEINVRSVMHADLNPGNAKKDMAGITYTDSVTGLFTLQNLAIDPHDSSSWYWLASPRSTYASALLSMYNYGYIGGGNLTYTNTCGVRPVVSISDVKLKRENGILKIKVNHFEKPEIIEKHIYTGTEHTITLDNFDSEIMKIEGTTSATDIGTYNVTVSLINPEKHAWVDGTTEPIELTWSIENIVVAGNISMEKEASINCSKIQNHTELTQSNFLINASQIVIPNESTGTTYYTKSYNATTGTLSISRNGITGSGTIVTNGVVYVSTTAKLIKNITISKTATIDCTGIADFTNKTASDFIIDLKWVDYPDEDYGTMSISKSYNASTGTLTISRTSISGGGTITFNLDVYAK